MAAFKISIQLSRELGRQVSLVSALNNLGECHQLLFDLEQALIYHQEGLALAEEAHFRLIEADLCRNLGLDLSYLGRGEEGLVYLQRALAIAEEVKTLDIQLYSLYALALAEVKRNSLEIAYNYIQELQALAAESQTRGHEANALHALGLYHQRQGNVDAAEEVWQQALFVAHETGKRVLLWQLHAALADIAATPNLANAHRRIAAEVIQQIAEPLEDEALRQTFLTAPPVAAILAQGNNT
jgi:tetratricopeptide (TPR) repeat protein